MMDAVESLPVLYISASNSYDVGYTIGSTLKHWITDYLQSSDDVITLRDFYATESGQSIVHNYLKTAEKFYPKIVSEIRGLADGAGQKFIDIFMLQIVSEITFCHIHEVKSHQESDLTSRHKAENKGCTDILVNTATCRVIGHNDDWTDDVAAFVCIVHVTIDNGDDIEQFVSYMYPGYIPGFCFGMNKNLVISLNSLSPREANGNGVPLLILLRSLFNCSSIEECIDRMKCDPVGCAYGMNINIAAINSSEMCSMEVYTEKDSCRLSVQYIRHDESLSNTDSSSYMYHLNAYRHAEHVRQADCNGSKCREDTLTELAPPKTLNDVICILSNTDHSLEPVFRTPNKQHLAPTVKTSATAIFDLKEKKLTVYKSNPLTAKRPCLTLSFIS